MWYIPSNLALVVPPWLDGLFTPRLLHALAIFTAVLIPELLRWMSGLLASALQAVEKATADRPLPPASEAADSPLPPVTPDLPPSPLVRPSPRSPRPPSSE